MTKNMEKFLEAMSAEGEEKRAAMREMDQAGLIALAAEKGILLTEADFSPAEAEGEVSLDEADAVAGGRRCSCTGVGYGNKDNEHNDGRCACVAFGSGNDQVGNERCMCVAHGQGNQCNGINGSIYQDN